jgi:hypothetical protein
MTDPILSCETATSLLARIADALERMAPLPVAGRLAGRARLCLDRAERTRVDHLEAPALGLMRGIDAQKAAVVANVERLASGAAAHDMLLWGSRGMGKSAVLRAAVKAADVAHPGRSRWFRPCPMPRCRCCSGNCAGWTGAFWSSSMIWASMPPIPKGRGSCARGSKAGSRRARPMCVWRSRQTAAPSSSGR